MQRVWQTNQEVQWGEATSVIKRVEVSRYAANSPVEDRFVVQTNAPGGGAFFAVRELLCAPTMPRSWWRGVSGYRRPLGHGGSGLCRAEPFRLAPLPPPPLPRSPHACRRNQFCLDELRARSIHWRLGRTAFLVRDYEQRSNSVLSTILRVSLRCCFFLFVATHQRTTRATQRRKPFITAAGFIDADNHFLDTTLAEQRYKGALWPARCVDSRPRADGNSGACLLAAHVEGDDLTVAWSGDCRAIVGSAVTSTASCARARTRA
jgi:hypothetical protein